MNVVLDREPDQEKSLVPSGPRIRCPPAAAPQALPLDLHPWQLLEYVRHWGSLPSVPPPMDFNPMPQVWRLVAAFGPFIHWGTRLE
jgi:hypothetical protein